MAAGHGLQGHTRLAGCRVPKELEAFSEMTCVRVSLEPRSHRVEASRQNWFLHFVLRMRVNVSMVRRIHDVIDSTVGFNVIKFIIHSDVLQYLAEQICG